MTKQIVYKPSFWQDLKDRLRGIIMYVSGGADGGEGTAERFDAVMRQYGNLVSSICYSYASDGNCFEELRQDAMINIWRGLQGYRGDAKMSTWIYRITLNTCVSAYRSRLRRMPGYVPIESIPELAEASGEERERMEYLHSLIRGLGSRDRGIILLWLDGAEYEEIAGIMGMNRNTIATRLRRIKEKLARLAEDKTY